MARMIDNAVGIKFLRRKYGNIISKNEFLLFT